MGGAVGLKGTDGTEILAEAKRRGAEPHAPARAVAALAVIAEHGSVAVLAPHGPMGEHDARQAGFEPTIVEPGVGPGATTAADTIRAGAAMADAEVDLLLFAGGDGTARDVMTA